ncbi:MAG: adenine deaminase [Oscillospiraceae bacterium]|nr:adenine deaminase [Oscillospiraceae bacterium]
MNELSSGLSQLRHLIDVAGGREPADIVLKNARYVNVFSGELCEGDIAVADGRIAGVGRFCGKQEIDVSEGIVCPGFIDSHIHLESSLVSPTEFAKAVVPHGTTCVVTDPHEITNVMGTDGIEYMLQATAGLPMDVYFMLPSCVPATPLDESGAVLDWQAIDRFYADGRVLGLAEMMNAFGVVHNDADVLQKLLAAKRWQKRIDGHAPGLVGNELDAYIAAGVASDHECADLSEAMEKLRRGQYIMIREGTAARNLEALAPLLRGKTAARCLLCTDDKHPSDLLEKGHIDYILKNAVRLGADPIAAVAAATVNAAQYFGLKDRGAIAPGCFADLTIVNNLTDFSVKAVYKDGVCRFDGQLAPFAAPVVDPRLREKARDTFHAGQISAKDFAESGMQGIIGMVPGQIVSTDNGRTDHADPSKDILRIAVIERHKQTGHIGLGYIQGYGLKAGAVATSISHDSHNLIVVGTSAEDMAFAAKRIVENRGGITVVKNGEVLGEVALELAGLMSDTDLRVVNEKLEAAKEAAYKLGVSRGIDPFMTLSFMSLPVIPALRLTTRGMVDVLTQQFV